MSRVRPPKTDTETLECFVDVAARHETIVGFNAGIATLLRPNPGVGRFIDPVDRLLRLNSGTEISDISIRRGKKSRLDRTLARIVMRHAVRID